ncbi:uncharacterized protein LOC126672667 [Mercurialis annua]|uniref:uncharacterized protein LOC126672667 n=1 Tax=Mercurialis annua TaxID=3986 RepID=UPI00215EA6BE|nr:uncharacterized protein LOC126672667 [Mercurialis annua]
MCPVQPKIRHLLWRICQGVLPCNDNLKKRAVPVLNCCPRCGEENETDVHALKDCVEVRGLWLSSPLGLRTDTFQPSSMVDWVSTMFTLLKGEEVQDFLTCIWVVWNDRNNIIFNNKRRHASMLFHCVAEFRRRKETGQADPCRVAASKKWEAPPVNVVKINSDATLVIQKNLSVAAAVCRDYAGKVVKCGVKILHGIVDVEVAETHGILLGMQLMEDFQGRQIVVESDALNVIHRLQQPGVAIDHTQLIVEDCLDLAKDREVVFRHIQRNGNVVSHALAKWGVFFGKDRLFIGEIPFPVNELVSFIS